MTVSTTETVSRSFFLCIFVALAIIGNIFVCIAIWTQKKLKTLTNYYVFNLAIADLAFGLTAMPMILINSIAGRWILGDALCQISGLLITLFSLVSIWSLTLISINRYVAVGRASSYKYIFRKNRVLVSIGLIWVFAVVMAVPPLIGWSRIIPGDNFCTIDGRKNMSYALVIIISGYFAPLIIMAVLYTRIFFVLRKHEKVMRKMRRKNRDMSINTLPGDVGELGSSLSSDYDSTLTDTRKHSALTSPPTFPKTDVIKGTSAVSKDNEVTSITTDGLGIKIGNPDVDLSQKQTDNTPGDINIPVADDATIIEHRDSISSEHVSSSSNGHVERSDEEDPRDRTASDIADHHITTANSNGEPGVAYKPITEDTEQRVNGPHALMTRLAKRSSNNLMKSISGLSLAIKRKRTGTKIRRFLREAKVTKMLFIVVAVFFLCWTPMVVGSVLYAFNVSPTSFNMLNFGITIACMNSICNFIIYSFMNKLFRTSFIEILYSMRDKCGFCFKCKTKKG